MIALSGPAAAVRGAAEVLRRAGIETTAPILVLLLEGDADTRTRAITGEVDRRPGTAIVATMPDGTSASPLRRALRAGAAGLILDADLEEALAPTVWAVASGQLAVPQALRRQIARAPLSYREKEILALVTQGFTNRQIADALFLAESTVKTHLSSVFGKLDARSRAEAAALALDADSMLVVPVPDAAQSA